MKHKHADLIIAWANGAKIQWYNTNAVDNEKWEDIDDPAWQVSQTYRITPKKYPKSTLHYDDLCRFLNEAVEANYTSTEGYNTIALRKCADEAIICFIVSGEMDKYLRNEGIIS